MKKLFLLLLSASCQLTFGQLGVNTYTPDSKSIMDIRSWAGKGGGVLLPRMDTETRRLMLVGGNADIIGLGEAQKSMLVYDTTQQHFYFYHSEIGSVVGPSFPNLAYTAIGGGSSDEDKQRGWQVMSPFRTQYTTKTCADCNPTTVFINRNLVLDTIFNGNVGIGFTDLTIAPTAKFEVNGDGIFRDKLAIGIASVDEYDKSSLQVNGNTSIADSLEVNKHITATSIHADTIGTTAKTLLQGYGACPIGTVLMWSPSGGGVIDKPTKLLLEAEGWMLCDGSPAMVDATYQGNVPDLRGRFIVGYDETNDQAPANATNKQINYGLLGNTGGKDVYALSEAEMPKHRHEMKMWRANGYGLATGSYGGWWFHTSVLVHANSLSEHNATADRYTEYIGSNQPHENRPAYYVLAYIIRVK